MSGAPTTGGNDRSHTSLQWRIQDENLEGASLSGANKFCPMEGVTVNRLHIGPVKTDILNYRNLSFRNIVLKFLSLFGKDANSSAQTIIHLAVSEDMEDVTGRYFVDCKEAPTSKLARRKDLATGLWEVSMKTVGL